MTVTPVHDHGIVLGTNAAGYVRGEGLHMSTLYNAMYEVLEPERFDKSTPMNLAKLEMGMALEESLEHAVKERLIAQLAEGSGRPGELIEPEHGIIYSPDLFLFNSHFRLGEIKLTWMSSREVPRVKGINGFPPKFDKYFTQMKLYCRCLDTPYARLIALFVNGDYDKKLGMNPELLVWDIEFTPRELKEEWDTVIGFAKGAKLL